MITPLGWVAIGLGLMGLEVLIPGFFIFWFGAAGLLNALLVAAGALPSPLWEWGVFFFSSLAFLVLWHKVLRPRYGKQTVDQHRDPTVSGQRGRVVSEIRPDLPGEVELSVPLYGNKRWRAMSTETILPDEEVEVLEAEGIRLVVRRIDQSQQGETKWA